MTTHVALLRGINLGAKNKVSKQTLLGVFSEAGAANVRTYIQSGNVLFDAGDVEATAIATAVTVAILERLGLTVPVVIRSVAELRQTVAANPFSAAGHPPDQLHVLFLGGQPTAEALARLDPARGAPDAFAVVDRAVYLHLPNGAARSRLSNDWFDRRLGMVSTNRNWRTTLKLLELCEQ